MSSGLWAGIRVLRLISVKYSTWWHNTRRAQARASVLSFHRGNGSASATLRETSCGIRDILILNFVFSQGHFMALEQNHKLVADFVVKTTFSRALSGLRNIIFLPIDSCRQKNK